jgi:hypothetical protein
VGKADRSRAASARARIAAQQAAARKAEARRRALIAAGCVVTVLAVVIVFIVIKANSKPAKPAAGPVAAAATTATVARDIATVPASVLDAVGAGPAGANRVTPLTKISGAPLTAGGKPEVLFIGAEYCPYCAAERWAMAVALSRFGAFSVLGLIHSTSNDVFSNTATLDFYKSSYASQYLTFTSVELQTVTGQTLQTPTPAEQQLMATYDVAPYTTEPNSIPFIDLGGKYLLISSQYLPSVLGSTPNTDATHFGLTWLQIAAALHDQSSPVAQSVLGAANTITAGLCSLTGGQPGSVCNSAAVKSIG